MVLAALEAHCRYEFETLLRDVYAAIKKIANDVREIFEKVPGAADVELDSLARLLSVSARCPTSGNSPQSGAAGNRASHHQPEFAVTI